MSFHWHADAITREVEVDDAYANTQNVRRFLQSECGDDFKFDREFMAWIRIGKRKNMGDVADEWTRRNRPDNVTAPRKDGWARVG